MCHRQYLSLGVGSQELFVAKRRSMHLHLLYDSFTREFFYFEILILMRKAIVVIIAVFVVSPQVQTQLAILLIGIAVVVQQEYVPYNQSTCNRLELYSLYTSFFTFFFGSLLYLSSEEVRVIFSVFVIVINLVFICYALRQILRHIVKEISYTHKKNPKEREKRGTMVQQAMEWVGNFV
uniref:Uncharacterized protein n=1 Tax=Lotharella oceanica TaxID=641309 RepID=A0A7S2TZX1_9EUKA|mmetsp:Transcript_34776/g.64373  ORF Transcript_34776/g.64373 Transcript_34776/m.64373 type:complete len:179 (+) Transcript_34776:449-985(+)